MIVVSRWFIAALLAACLLLAGSGGVFAGERQGGGTWGDILQMDVQRSGQTVSVTVSKRDGRPFSMESDISIRSGSANGPILKSDTIRRGKKSAVLTVDLDQAAPDGQPLYAYLANSYGHAWVGPAQMAEPDYGGGDNDYHRPLPPRGRAPEPPYIDSWPKEGELCREVLIGVTARPSLCRPGRVRIECKAEDDGRPFSQWLQPGEKEYLRFNFRAAGDKTICCRTVDDCDRSSEWSRRTIRIKECNQPPAPPRIALDPCDACVNEPVRISVTPGPDPDDDQVRIECRAADARPSSYDSGLISGRRSVEAVFTFGRTGKKRISCVAYDSKGARSESVSRLIDIRRCEKTCDDGKCRKPCRDGSCRSRTETTISISVVSEAGSDGSRVRVRRGGGHHHPGPVSYDEPYLPEDQGWSPQYQAEQDEEQIVDIPLNPDYHDERIQQDYDEGP